MLSFFAPNSCLRLTRNTVRNSNRRSRAVVEASLDGLISLYSALAYPKVFSRVAGQSSAPHLAEAETTLELSVRGKSLSR
jgi:enterochelin esterase-like enzyme